MTKGLSFCILVLKENRNTFKKLYGINYDANKYVTDDLQMYGITGSKDDTKAHYDYNIMTTRIQGDDQGRLLPGGDATRVEAATMIRRYIENL